MHKLKTRSRVTGWSVYVHEAGATHHICDYPKFEQVKRRAHEITSDPMRLSQLRGEQEQEPSLSAASRIDVVCETCNAPIGVACTCAEGLAKEKHVHA